MPTITKISSNILTSNDIIPLNHLLHKDGMKIKTIPKEDGTFILDLLAEQKGKEGIWKLVQTHFFNRWDDASSWGQTEMEALQILVKKINGKGLYEQCNGKFITRFEDLLKEIREFKKKKAIKDLIFNSMNSSLQ